MKVMSNKTFKKGKYVGEIGMFTVGGSFLYGGSVTTPPHH